MNTEDLLANLRAQPFYRGQIIRVEEIDGDPPESVGADEVCAELDHLPSLPSFLRVLGLSSVYRSLLAGLRRGFPRSEKETDRDIVMAGAPGRGRNLFIDLSVILEAVDESGLSLVLCSGRDERDRFASRLRETIARLDIGYAVSLVAASSATDFAAAAAGDFPDVVVVDPDGLAMILEQEEALANSPGFYDALRRVVVPSLETWAPAVFSNAAVLLRRLHLEATRCGGAPSFLAAAKPTECLHDVATRFWGKPLATGAIVRHESEERAPLTVVNYGAPLISDPASPDRWIREDERPGTESLLKWLAGNPRGQGRVELHYVIDVSGSMYDCLDAVGRAVIRDLQHRFDGENALREKDLVKLTKFESDATQVYKGEVGDDSGESVVAEFAEQVGNLECEGGTNITAGLGTALESALEERELGELRILLFSDGYSCMSSESKEHLLGMIRELRSKGVILRLVYVLLDMEPPIQTRNLIRELGGQLVEQAKDALASMDSFGDDDPGGKWVVFYAGERGLSEEVVGPASGGLRKVVHTRDLGFLPAEVDPRQVHAVVTSGVFPSRHDLLERLSCLGGRKLPVFILTPADAHARLLTEAWPEASRIEPTPFLAPNNAELLGKSLAPIAGAGGLPTPVFDYLCRGSIAYEGMVNYYRLKSTKSGVSSAPEWVPDTFQLDESGAEPLVRAPSRIDGGRLSLESFSAETCQVTGFGLTGVTDRSTAPMLFHRGADLDWANEPGQIDEISSDGSIHVGRSEGDLNVPILEAIRIESVASAKEDEQGWDHSRIGSVRWKRIDFRAEVAGIRTFKGRNFDSAPNDYRHPSPQAVRFPTRALLWTPEGLDLSSGDSQPVIAGLANVLRLTLPAVFPNCQKHVLVVPDFEQGIWLVETAPGGNGATRILELEEELLGNLLRLGGRLALDCPCEGGFAGCSDETNPAEVDTGCPRCTRTIGPVIRNTDSPDRFSKVSKSGLLSWLQSHDILPSSAADHIEEKTGAGITDERRVWLRDYGSRRAFLPMVRRIFADRLGVTIQEADLPRFEWPDANEEANATWAGVYFPAQNLIKIRKGMREWQALDVFAHELFHALQHHGTAPIHPDLMGEGIPCDGKLFLEGAAVWAESHFADALAVRTMLDLNNLREGDEYGEGFRIMKWLEMNHGGVQTVLRFLATGDAATATGGRCRTLPELIRAGIS